MAILLLFNDRITVSYDEIQKTVGLHEKYLDSSLVMLLKSKVLNATFIDTDKQFTLNTDFKSKRIRVALNVATKAEQKQEIELTHSTIQEDRELLMVVGTDRICSYI
jgi:cullin 1